jgi:hypothetical protein
MTGPRFWDRFQDEIRTASGRARREAERAVRSGMLRVDLVSLRRDRRGALAHLGERVLALWSGDRLSAIAEDPEALRLRALVQSIEGLIAVKEEELRSIRSGSEDSARAQ